MKAAPGNRADGRIGVEGREEDFVAVFKALADETRLEIVRMLTGGEMCACEILRFFAIAQPTLSYHMRILTDSGLVAGQREGAWMHYRIDERRYEQLRAFVTSLSPQPVPQEAEVL